MRFSTTMEGLGVNLIEFGDDADRVPAGAAALSAHVTELPLVGAIPYPLVVVAIAWSLFGTVFLAVVGIKLPGLEFRNQRVEAAYRKELVYGEDDARPRRPADGRRAVRQRAARTTSGSISTTCISTWRASVPAGGQRSFPDVVLWCRPSSPERSRSALMKQISTPSTRSQLVPVSGQFLADDRRAALDLQAPARLRGDARRRAAAGYRPALSWSARRPTSARTAEGRERGSAADAGRAGRRRAARCGRGSRGS